MVCLLLFINSGTLCFSSHLLLAAVVSATVAGGRAGGAKTTEGTKAPEVPEVPEVPELPKALQGPMGQGRAGPLWL